MQTGEEPDYDIREVQLVIFKLLNALIIVI